MKSLICLLLLISSFQLQAQYCVPTYNEDPPIHIHNFYLGDILNRNTFHSEGNPYIFYEDVTTELEMGRTYPISASGEVTSGLKGDWAIWIDFNEDEVFTIDERIWYETDVRSFTGDIEIPNNVNFLGQRRMRISYVWTSQELDPCGDYSSGETEDYIVTFVDQPIDKSYYCIPFDALNTDAFYINDFNFGEIVNENSKSNDYNFSSYSFEDFPNQFLVGESYGFNIVKDGQDGLDGGFAAWIDYNDDQVFSEDELVVEDGPDVFQTSGSIVIPADEEFVGKRKMRVRAGRSAAIPLDACGFDSSTETEDYIINIVTEITDISEINDAKDFRIYPNPSADFINIESLERGDFSYKIYNVFGQLMKEGRLVEGQQRKINVVNLQSSMYVILIDVNGKIFKQTFMKN